MDVREQMLGLQEKQKSFIVKARKVISNFLTYRNTIDKLMEDKVEDYVIVRELPLSIAIHDKRLMVGTFSMETQDIFFKEYTKLLAAVAARHANLELGAEMMRGAEFLHSGPILYQILQNDKFIKNLVLELISKTILKKQNWVDPVTGEKHKLPKISLGWIKKNASYEDIIQICFLIYIYNFDATRRSLQLILGELDAQQSSETYIYSWLKNLVGLNGKFLQNQLIKSGFQAYEPPKQAFQEAIVPPPKAA